MTAPRPHHHPHRHASPTPAGDPDAALPPFLQRARRLAAIASARMPDWQRRAIYLAVAALLLSGGGWLLLHHFGAVDGEFGPSPSPWEHPALAVHGAAAMAFLFLFGSLLPVHVMRGLALRHNRLSGHALLILNGVLALSGCGLYYVGGDRLRAAISLLHWLPGLLLAALLALHVVLGRRRRRRSSHGE